MRMIAIPSHIILLFLFTILWTFLYVRRRSVHREMLVIGFLSVIFTPVIYFLNAQALHISTGLTITLSHFLFSFLFAGVASVIFHEFFGRKYRRRKPLFFKHHLQDAHWLLHLFLLIALWAWVGVLFVYLLQTSAFQGLIVSALLIGMLVISVRHDLIWDAIWSGVLMMIVFFLLYEIAFFQNGPVASSEWWGVMSLQERFIGSVPLEALIWAAVTAFVLGPLYEYVRGFKLSLPR